MITIWDMTKSNLWPMVWVSKAKSDEGHSDPCHAKCTHLKAIKKDLPTSRGNSVDHFCYVKGKWWIQHWAKDQVQIVEAESEGVAGQTNDHQAILLTFSPGSHKLTQLFLRNCFQFSLPILCLLSRKWKKVTCTQSPTKREFQIVEAPLL